MKTEMLVEEIKDPSDPSEIMLVGDAVLVHYNYFINVHHLPHCQKFRSFVTGPYQEGDQGTIIPHGFNKFDTKYEAWQWAFTEINDLIHKDV